MLWTCSCFLSGHLPLLQWASHSISKIFLLLVSNSLRSEPPPHFHPVPISSTALASPVAISPALSVPRHNPPLLSPQRLTILHPPGSVIREEAARLSRSRMGREEGTEMLSGTQRQSCSWNRKELQLGPDCSARQGQGRPESRHCTYLLSHAVSPAWHRPALSHVDLPSVKLWENSDQVINFIRVGRQEWNLISLCNG